MILMVNYNPAYFLVTCVEHVLYYSVLERVDDECIVEVRIVNKRLINEFDGLVKHDFQ
jgi:hypothetical protein